MPELSQATPTSQSDPARDLAMYAALLGHAVTIDPTCPPPTDLIGEQPGSRRRWLERLREGWRYQASRPTWLGELLSGIEQRLREGFARVQETPRQVASEPLALEQSEARPAMRYRVAA